ncbi:YveK family protein [Anaerobium acetethylicum]|uniref:Capsular polysaccharide biosynthesis protein n=1 Tax=Anaerobium acetethylicum TaxID=1619234 RepID=A0A1D3TRD4_9FIRM|nr:Wzz/FepE/Etk N-terminal domain-containing protein [Anaerobium acetethylicum]SCP96279.1 Capsular polysaccharide biosynthesis protein [Anaerobium acetethylicum]
MEREKKKKTEDNYDLKQLFFILFEKFWIIMLAAVGMALFMYIFTKVMIDPVYESSTKIYVLNREDTATTTFSDLQTSAQLTKDYQVMVQSRPVIEKVIHKLGLSYGVEEVLQMVSVSELPDTRILQITVRNKDPEMAKSIADALADVSAARIAAIMDIEKVKTVEEGNFPIYAVSPNVLMNVAIGGMAGIVLSCFVILLVYMFDDSIKNENDIEEYLNLSILGLIPIAEEEEKHDRKTKKIKDKYSKEKYTRVKDARYEKGQDGYAEREDRYRPEDGLSK